MGSSQSTTISTYMNTQLEVRADFQVSDTF